MRLQPLTVSVSRMATLEAFGVKLALSGGAAMDATIELAEKNPDWEQSRGRAAYRWRWC
jgi:hypothetical protein